MTRQKYSLLWINEHHSGTITIRAQVGGEHFFYGQLFISIFKALSVYDKIQKQGTINLKYWHSLDKKEKEPCLTDLTYVWKKKKA